MQQVEIDGLNWSVSLTLNCTKRSDGVAKLPSLERKRDGECGTLNGGPEIKSEKLKKHQKDASFYV